MSMRAFIDAVGSRRRHGVLREVYQEAPGSSFTDDGLTYDLNLVLGAIDAFPTAMFEVKDLTWVLDYDDADEDRVEAASLRYPVLVSYYQTRFVVIDGLHRLAKATEREFRFITGKFVPESILQRALLGDAGA